MKIFQLTALSIILVTCAFSKRLPKSTIEQPGFRSSEGKMRHFRCHHSHQQQLKVNQLGGNTVEEVGPRSCTFPYSWTYENVNHIGTETCTPFTSSAPESCSLNWFLPDGNTYTHMYAEKIGTCGQNKNVEYYIQFYETQSYYDAAATCSLMGSSSCTVGSATVTMTQCQGSFAYDDMVMDANNTARAGCTFTYTVNYGVEIIKGTGSGTVGTAKFGFQTTLSSGIEIYCEQDKNCPLVAGSSPNLYCELYKLLYIDKGTASSYLQETSGNYVYSFNTSFVSGYLGNCNCN